MLGSVARGQAGPESDLDLYVVTRSRVFVLRDERLTRVRRVREGPEYQALVREGYRPDLAPLYHTEAFRVAEERTSSPGSDGPDGAVFTVWFAGDCRVLWGTAKP